MMNGQEKSDSGIVAVKPANKAGRPVAELVEPRPETKGNAEQQRMHRTQSRARMSQSLGRVRKAARLRKKDRFTALFHHINVDTLRTAFYALRRKAAAGVDGMTWQDYEADLEPRLKDLHKRVHSGAYRPQPSRRTYIPKADGKQRPLAIAALEDKIVQGATVMVLNAIYEGDFCGFSYGFRPGRGPHDALDALCVAIDKRKVNWILDADIQNFFGAVSQEWLVRFVEHRIGDKRIIRLIRKWLKAGMEQLPERQACRIMVELLAMAHERGCESELADQLAATLKARRLPDMAALRERFAPRSLPATECRRAPCFPRYLRSPVRHHERGGAASLSPRRTGS